jgi:alpha-ketoglutaric semialdehyde dehydrogenase
VVYGVLHDVETRLELSAVRDKICPSMTSSTTTLKGTSIIGSGRGESNSGGTPASNPATGETLEPAFVEPSPEEVDRAASLAAEAAIPFGKLSGRSKAQFLRAIAKEIEDLGDVLVERATAETALPAARIQGERGRTCGQLRMFADLVEDGSWVDARIDHADPERQPAPKPDTRSMLRPVGPVAVFCASNFPLAFSVAGGDTASALAAGNPVIVKAHSAHPGTAELVGNAVRAAVEKCGLPEGVFSLLFGGGRSVGAALVKDARVKAVGFTGSRAGGRALMDIAAAREEPIPVYAEMSSINPVFVLPGAMAERGEALATGLHGSVTMGVGQFCTNPGLVMIGGELDESFAGTLTKLMGETAAATMLTSGICEAYRNGVNNLKAIDGVEALVCGDSDGNAAAAAVFKTDAATFMAGNGIDDEVFGPATLLVTHDGREQMLELARSMEGQLTATLHGTEEDLKDYAELVQVLETRVGRLVVNAFPTGVEVNHSMVHGGPYPATSDGRSTSVGTQAIYRFSRPVCYQGFPQGALPDELTDANPLGVKQLVDGVLK